MTQTVLLGDILVIRSGKSRPKESGKFPVYGGNGIFDSSNVTNIKNPAVIVGRVGAYCGSVYIERNPFWLSDNALGIETREGVDLGYVYYLLKSLNLNSRSVGGAQPLMTQSILKNISVSVPELDKQKKIADILETIDEKIELNRKMNETLEQMGQALFRHYFIDNPEAEKWGKAPVGAKISPKRGKSLQSRNMVDGNVPVISGGLQPAGAHNESNTKPPVVTISASGANAGFVSLWSRPVWSADSSYIDRSITEYVYTYYLFLRLKQKDIYGMQTGSGQPHVYPKHIELLEITDAPESVFLDFERKIEPLFEKNEDNNQEIQTLTILRDTLLPRLMNGKAKFK